MAKAAGTKVAKTKTVAYDVAEQLRKPEEMAAYLDAWLVEAPDDAAGIARALGDIARAKGMTQVAQFGSRWVALCSYPPFCTLGRYSGLRMLDPMSVSGRSSRGRTGSLGCIISDAEFLLEAG